MVGSWEAWGGKIRVTIFFFQVQAWCTMEAGTTMQAGLAALQRTHEVYRLAREKVEAREKVMGEGMGTTDGVHATPIPGDGESARAVAERELSESLRMARGAHAGQAVAGRRAAEEREQLQAALREAREVAAQQAAYSREELLQERQRRAKLESERQAEAATSAVARLTAEQRLQTQAASAKRETSTLEAMLIDAQARRPGGSQQSHLYSTPTLIPPSSAKKEHRSPTIAPLL
jgi:hypothetical protein